MDQNHNTELVRECVCVCESSRHWFVKFVKRISSNSSNSQRGSQWSGVVRCSHLPSQRQFLFETVVCSSDHLSTSVNVVVGGGAWRFQHQQKCAVDDRRGSNHSPRQHHNEHKQLRSLQLSSGMHVNNSVLQLPVKCNSWFDVATSNRGV